MPTWGPPVLWIPDGSWSLMLDRLAETPAGLERVAYLDGVHIRDRAGALHSVVTTVVLPDAELNPRWFRVPADAMGQAGEHLFTHGLRRLAQVHTHGNHDTGHSPIDDRRAYSQQDGALSIVLPFHAAHRPAPTDGAVHVREPDGWTQLSPADAADHVRLVPALLDHRRAPEPTTKPDPLTRWRRLLRLGNNITGRNGNG
jgi:hypothetical protein